MHYHRHADGHGDWLQRFASAHSPSVNSFPFFSPFNVVNYQTQLDRPIIEPQVKDARRLEYLSASATPWCFVKTG